MKKGAGRRTATSKEYVRLLTLLLATATLTAAPAWAGQAGASPPAAAASPATGAPLDLPVSLDRIRRLLAELPSTPLVGLDDLVYFRVQIIERRRIDELLDLLTVDSGPRVPGGLYGYQQQQNIWSLVNHPSMQPYAAFSQGELATIAVENVIGRLIGGPIVHAIATARGARARKKRRTTKCSGRSPRSWPRSRRSRPHRSPRRPFPARLDSTA